MPKLTKEDKGLFEEKLKYIGLDLDNIPEFLKDFRALEFRPTNKFDNLEYKVYRFIPTKDIQILVSNTNRLTDIKEKYEKAKPIWDYLQTDSEEQIEYFATFLNMLKNTDISQIQEIEKQQEDLGKAIPYNIKYEKNYIWQIYYSEYSNQYFMLVPSNDMDFGALFFLLREQIKNENKYIYVPVANFEPGDEILKRDERADIENYLWLFTNNWPNIYEVTLKDGSKKIAIVGETKVYDSVFAKYHLEFESRKGATEFYKQLKALFILQTELQAYYTFSAKIDNNGNLTFYYKDKKIDYENLGKFITEEFIETRKKINKMIKLKRNLTIKLDELKFETRQKEITFLNKQKEISTYLEYKKTFFGKVKYFFSRKKKDREFEVKAEGTVIGPEEEFKIEEKSVYNIEDLVTIYSKYSQIESDVKNKELDVEALELKLYNLNKKIENATLYIKEIDSHRKSIFEFWKFSSKDEALTLNPGKEEEQTEQKQTLRKVFSYESDREEITKQIDKLQREHLSKDEQDSLYVLNDEILSTINKIKAMVKIPDENISHVLENLKAQEVEEKDLSVSEYDIFGGLSEDRTKIKVLGKNKHRETEKNKYKILGINSDTTLKDFKDALKKIENSVLHSFGKAKTIIDMPIYKVISSNEKIDQFGFGKFSMSVEDELSSIQTDEKEYNLIKLYLKENMPAIFYTNIIFFDNFNKTLPLGMDKSDSVLIDSNNFTFVLKDKQTIYTNNYFTKETDSKKLDTKKINIYEYEIDLKRKEA